MKHNEQVIKLVNVIPLYCREVYKKEKKGTRFADLLRFASEQNAIGRMCIRRKSRQVIAAVECV